MSERTDLPFDDGGADGSVDVRWQANLLATARALPYPNTPDVTVAVLARLSTEGRSRPLASRRPVRLAWAVAVILVILLALLAVPAVRAVLLDFLQIGGVRIIVRPTSTPVATATPANTAQPAITPTPSPTPLHSVLDLAGQTTLANARQHAGFSIRLPTYPPDLGEPDLVYMQSLDTPTVIVVWLEPGDRTKVRLSLQYLNSTADFEKTIGTVKQGPPGVEFTQVNGQGAVWTTGPYILQTGSGIYKQQRLIEGHVLIWTDGVLTYRLETKLTLAEAVRVAESLR